MSDGKSREKAPFGLLAVGVGLMILSVYLLMDRFIFRHPVLHMDFLDLIYNLIKYIFPAVVLFILGKGVLCRRYWAKQTIIFISGGTVFLGLMKLLKLWEMSVSRIPSHEVILKSIIQIMVGIGCFYFFTRSKIKEQFCTKVELQASAGGDTKSNGDVGIVIRILGVTAILLGVGIVMFGFLGLELSALHPTPIPYLILLFGLVFIIGGAGILTFRNWGRNLILILGWLCGILPAGLAIYWKRPIVIIWSFFILFFVYFLSLGEVRRKFR